MLRALEPLHTLGFVTQHGWASFVVLGAVLLAFTGAEALYADMGHFGKAPIRMALVQVRVSRADAELFRARRAALCRRQGAGQPLLSACAGMGLYPLVALATAATVIASQAAISGTYSLSSRRSSSAFCRACM